MTSTPRRLFEAAGIELEYMIVNAGTLDVRPIADEVLKAVAGEYAMEVEFGNLAWSNELALHVIELKTLDPVASFEGLAAELQAQVAKVLDVLRPMGARLLPAAMHPWMNPDTELRLWPHEADVIYATFNRIFDCRGHGWANLQSTHVNLPFANGDEFGRLHAAMRLVLPLIPALAASSPVKDGHLTGLRDTRIDVYRHNADRVPSVAGAVVPEPVFTPEAYRTEILERIYDDLRSVDPDGILRHEWVNARGCIARFDRMAIEMRVIDAQECARADVAVAAAVVEAVRWLVEDASVRFEEQARWDVARLGAILDATVRDADDAQLEDAEFLAVFGLTGGRPRRAGDVWRHLVDRGLADRLPVDTRPVIETITTSGTLATRLTRALGHAPDRARLAGVYRELAECVSAGHVFEPAPRATG